MAAPLRVGLECEMHGLYLTFQRTDTTDWQFPAAGLDTIIGDNYPILAPLDHINYKAGGARDSAVVWPADWGFRAVGDAFGPLVVQKPNTTTSYTIQRCTLELQTAAQPVSNVDYWVFARRCLQAFRNAMGVFALATYPASSDFSVSCPGQPFVDRWTSLQDFLDVYNQAVEGIQAPAGYNKNRFKLRMSDRVQELSAGTANGQAGSYWAPFFSIVRPIAIVGNQPTPSTSELIYGDVQLSSSWPSLDVQGLLTRIAYEMDLVSLWNNTAQWTSTWGSTWAYFIRGTPMLGIPDMLLDPVNGTERSKFVLSSDMYSTQAYKALWLTAKNATIAYTAALNLATLPADGQAILKSLIMYLFVVGAVKFGGPGASTSKNALVQLPKSSPASIAMELLAMYPQSGPLLTSLATQLEVDRAVNIWATSGPTVLLPPQLPVGGPSSAAGVLNWSQKLDYLATPIGTMTDQFKNMWRGAFRINDAIAWAAQANKRGFTERQPYYIPWAPDTKTSKAAETYATGVGTQSIKILLESRYSSSILNNGFTPFANDAMFKSSYLSLIQTLSPATLGNNTVTLNAYFPGVGPITQHFAPRMVNGVQAGSYVH